MLPFYFLKIAKDSGSGLCNQIYALCGCIDHAIQSKKYSIIIVDNFLKEIQTNDYIPLGDILDIPKLQVFLLKKYQILLYDKNKLNVKIESIFYDEYCENEKISQTQQVTMEHFMHNDTFFFPKGNDINDLFQEKIHEKNKNGKITVRMKMNEQVIILFFNVKNNYLDQDIHINTKIHHQQEKYLSSPQLFFGGSLQPNVFIELIQNIHFHFSFNDNSKKSIDNIIQKYNLHDNTKQKINIVHLRLEEDAVLSFSYDNKINKNNFKKTLEEKYISLIKKYIHPTQDFTILLANDYENSVIDFLNTNNYRFFCSKKLYLYRECNAIHDLLFYNFCNNIFIGVYESSFSYTLMYKLFTKDFDGSVRSIIFKMNEVEKQEKIFTKYSSIDETRQG